MKEGLIVYLVGGADWPQDFDAAPAARALAQSADHVEVVAPDEGFFSVEDAWHFLFTRGCGRISLLVAQPGDGGALSHLGPRVRLCG